MISSSIERIGELPGEAETIAKLLLDRIRSHEARVAVVGLGYVGLPSALAFATRGYPTIGFDVDPVRVADLNAGLVTSDDVVADIASLLSSGRFRATTDFADLRACDCITVSVPTPLDEGNAPDLSFIRAAAAEIALHLRRGQLVVLESTTYPGATDEIFLSAFRAAGFELDRDFLLAFSPERIDPGNGTFRFGSVPRIVGGASPDSLAVAAAWYREIVPSVKTVSSTRVAEAAKLLENTFRAVNIGLINELAMMCHRMDIDVWEVIEAAKTKPFGFMPFYPGPGVGGHCIPLVPEFFSWKGRQFGVQSRFIHLAEEINGAMPAFTTGLVDDALNGIGKPVAGARVLLIGVSYKKDVGDAAESPALEIIARLRAKGAIVVYHDPFVPTVDLTNAPLKHLSYDREPLASVALTAAELRDADCTVVVTGHSDVDYALIAREARVIVDTRNMIDPALVPADTELVRL